MKLGMPTLIELETLEENVALCAKLGLDFVEINMNLPNYQTDVMKAEDLNMLQKKYNKFFTFHLPEDIDIAHFNQKVRKAHLDTVLETIELAKAINSPLINMHMNLGIYFTLPNQRVFLYEKYRDDYMAAIGYFAELIDEQLRETAIQLLIENTGIYDRTYITDAIDLMLEVESVALTWDIGHDYVADYVDKSFIENRAIRLKHLHIHDAQDQKNHLKLYDGDIDLGYYLHLVGEMNITAVIETKTIEALEASVLELKQRGYMN